MQQYTNQLIQQYLLKACFVLNLRFQKKKIENTQNLFDLILLITQAYYSQDLLLFQQVQANLNCTVVINKEKNMDYFRKQLEQFHPDNKLKIAQAQKFVRECEYKQCEQNIIIPTLVDEIEAKIEKENAKLQVWINFLNELRKSKKLIDQTKRLNIEEVLYFSEE
ncbi:hypothetical protein PPERSA_11825 [Pseudocohnilembus persalinus]|uniref:Uncharacterized protein n=1 Tax=Pseudocohnilembus persalinus TaxID=266149 RepID=A0A0V0QKD5_PSEPJ|nr:hypothetical protein PPERSA_11825 [Pseudocohnilembus persalinus]|eukprot:KRX02485.1 hypothetical protein PPERSA_11825 [Pseudocohnilembus persalinus]